MSKKKRSLSDRIFDALPVIHALSVREVAHAVGVFTELWEVRTILDELVASGKAYRDEMPLTQREIKEKGLHGEHYRYVYRRK